jgi:hypothetical protein
MSQLRKKKRLSVIFSTHVMILNLRRLFVISSIHVTLPQHLRYLALHTKIHSAWILKWNGISPMN